MALLTVKDLIIEYPDRHGVFQATKNVNLELERGEILGIVGESGAGKSTIGNAVMGLLQSPGRIANGQIHLDQTRLDTLSNEKMRKIRGKRIGMIFQDPMTSLNPLERIEDQLVETILLHLPMDARQAKDRAIELLTQVGIPNPTQRIRQYPHEFSGGMRQRVVIALALAGEPDLIIADEPTTALDVSIQAQILQLIRDLCRDKNVGMILVTHDMGVISQTADRVAVMYRGNLVELAETKKITQNPQHEYTKALISAVPPSNRRVDRFAHVGFGAKTRALDTLNLAEHWLGQSRSDAIASKAVLTVNNLNKVFRARSGLLASKGIETHAVKDVSLQVQKGTTYGIVGESGSGKSTIARLITGIHPATSGTMFFDGLDLRKRVKSRAEVLKQRQIQMIFQDPYSSLNPRMRVGQIVAEPILVNKLAASKSEALSIARDLLDLVELEPGAEQKFPHAFSGGQRQRISIARALASRPKFLICDEPTSALDVSIQAQILNLMKDLQDRLQLTLLFISHDLPVMRQMCDEIAVMRHGEIVEFSEAEDIFVSPQHSYTQELISLMPKFESA